MIGTILSNRYELLEKIGEGGMAEVYKARCHKLNRFDAVKILKKEFSHDSELVDKFKREATAVANLSDNNIINIFDVGTQGDIHFIVMEYVKGRTLKDIIVENVRLSYERSIDIAIQIARALDCAHRNNIIHRDVKPQNILVTNDGIVKVTDFGIAKAPTSVTITNSNKIMGSAHYFSPEQARGSFVDARTDIYSLGIVLYEMVTGKVPYDAESPVSVALKHIQEPVIPPRNIAAGIPESLNKLILKAIEKDPAKRYQTIKEMLIDLIRIQKDMNYDIIPNNIEDDFTKVMSPVNYKSNRQGNDVSEDDGNDSEVSNKTKKIIIFSLLAVMVIILGAIVGWKLSMKPLGPSNEKNEIKLPDIIGLDQDRAREIIEEKGLKFNVIAEENSDEPAGTVLKTWPDPGTVVRPNYEVRVRISKGLDTIELQSLVDLDYDSAEELILGAGLKVGTIDEEFSDTVPENAIISQYPKANSSVEVGSKVNLVISKGPEKIKVPDLTNLTTVEAENTLKNLGLKLSLKTTKVTNDKALDGKIFLQDLEKDSEVPKGTEIKVSYYVFEEAEKVIVPDFVGKTIEEARAMAEVSEGQIQLTVPADADSKDIIVTQDITADTEVEEGTNVTVTVEKPVTENEDGGGNN